MPRTKGGPEYGNQSGHTDGSALVPLQRRATPVHLPAPPVSETDADDVLQDIFLRIHNGTLQVERAEQVPAWIYTVARRAVADVYRAHYRRPEDALIEADELAGEVPADGHLASYRGGHDVHEEVLSWLRPVIDELAEPYRTALLLADVEGGAATRDCRPLRPLALGRQVACATGPADAGGDPAGLL